MTEQRVQNTKLSKKFYQYGEFSSDVRFKTPARTLGDRANHIARTALGKFEKVMACINEVEMPALCDREIKHRIGLKK